MSDPFAEHPVPRLGLIAMGALAGLSIVLAAAGRYGDFGRSEATPASSSQAAVQTERVIQFEDRTVGGVRVVDGTTGAEIDILQPGNDGFVRGVLRGLVRQRRLANASMEPGFTLTHWSDGRLTLKDMATNQQIDLNAFGATNLEAFARFLPSESIAVLPAQTARQEARVNASTSTGGGNTQ